MTSPVSPAQRRAIFVDVDGTLTNHLGQIPDSARSAIGRARGAGHLTFLCTGRSPATFWKDIVSIGWDGVVGAAGGYVEVGGEVIVQRHLGTDQVTRVVDYFRDHDVEFMLETNAVTYSTPKAPEEVWTQMLDQVGDEELHAQLMRSAMAFVHQLNITDDLVRDDVNKIVFLGHSGLSFDQIRTEFPDFDLVPASVPGFGGEMSQRGVHKASGVAAVLEKIGLDRSASVGFGDGYNDLEMLQYVGVGVAMGQAPEAVKAVSDMVTSATDDDGLARGLAELGLA